ncbi:hypothetical protein BDV23DRAFT_187498 [Aspergillus alliaceus]|uniref:MARVEL domain-containing protein n=1 Tax=Petromyces alliaceus TaxID=209559 RepID=A0A5N7BWI6_PETAA|nr:hypothetical protein BDV23DRAFT_187498 [Aspergillus alliaceus]
MPKTKPPTRKLDQYWHKPGICGLITRSTLRTLQFTFAVIISALYGVDLANATKTNTHASSEWIYAEFVAAVSALTCIIHCFVTVIHVAWSAWDAVLFVLWLAQVGRLGSIYVSDVQGEYEDATMSITRMRVAVWIGLVNMVLWLGTTVLGVAWCVRTKKATRRTDLVEGGKQEILSDVERVAVYVDRRTPVGVVGEKGVEGGKGEKMVSEKGVDC